MTAGSDPAKDQHVQLSAHCDALGPLFPADVDSSSPSSMISSQLSCSNKSYLFAVLKKPEGEAPANTESNSGQQVFRQKSVTFSDDLSSTRGNLSSRNSSCQTSSCNSLERGGGHSSLRQTISQGRGGFFVNLPVFHPEESKYNPLQDP